MMDWILALILGVSLYPAIDIMFTDFEAEEIFSKWHKKG